MSKGQTGKTPGTGPGSGVLADRWAMWRGLRLAGPVGFVAPPEPRTIGMYARGKMLLAGSYFHGGGVTERPDLPIWDVNTEIADFVDLAQGFGWLDDLAAVGDARARARAQDWTWEWIARFGGGRGPGWRADILGRRVVRWINHAPFLTAGKPGAEADRFQRYLTAQARLLARRWGKAQRGLPRVEALTGMVIAGLALQDMGGHVAPALKALDAEVMAAVDEQGGIGSRNPEELLDLFTHLTWAEEALAGTGRLASPGLQAGIERIAPVLRVLRHADGGLARFQGGGRGMEGRLDQALAAAGVRAVAGQHLAMGYVRLQGGRTTLIVDGAAPPAGRASHASTNAFELTSGRRPLIVSCGSGTPFGADWHQAGRATASHSTLCIEGYSSSRFGAADEESLVDKAQVTVLRLNPGENGLALHIAHDGWARTHGLSHVRDLALTNDGRHLSGVDRLSAISTAEKRRFEQLLAEGRVRGVEFALRFHVHPDVEATLDMGGRAVSLVLRSGEIWVFRSDGVGRLSLDPSIYLEKARMQPRATQQIVLSARAGDFETALGWTLAKAQDTPLAIRDLERDEIPT
jgi:uncharacterized heparinase superfamily protein